MKKLYTLFFLLFAFCSGINAQNVTVTATGNVLTADYMTVGEAFIAINDGTHLGVIEVKINASTNEGLAPASLNSSDADPASYTSVKIYPTADGVTVQGSPLQGYGVIQLNGSDSVTIDGDNPNTGGTNRNLTFVNVSANSTLYSSVIRIATSAAIISANNITIKNCIINGNVTNGNVNLFPSTSVNNTFGIYAGGRGGPFVIGEPEAITNETSDKALTGTTINNLVIQNNLINRCARAVSFMGEITDVNNSLLITGNEIGTSAALGAYPYAAPATTVYSKGITITGSEAITISNNTLQNIMQFNNNNVMGIELQNPIGSVAITTNTLSGVVNNGTGGSDARGIFVNSVGAPYTIIGNTISNVESFANGLTSGILINANSDPGTIDKNTIFNIISRNTGGAAAINLGSPANNMVVQNNFIYDVRNNLGSSFAANRGVHGILINLGSNHKIYHNSIHLYGPSTASTTNYYTCLSIFSNGLTGIDVRNNIFANTVTAGTASDAHVALFMPFTAAASMNLTLNNNAYYTGNVVGKQGIAFAGAASYNPANFYYESNFNAGVTTPAANWRSFSSSLGVPSNDNASMAFITPVPFTSNTNLHIPNGATQTPLESGGASVGVLLDIDGQVRPGPAGSVNGGGTLPDIGADEFDRQLEDRIPPVIGFTPPVACGVGPRFVSATITDATGVPTAGIGLPVLYYRIAAGAWTPVQSTWGGGSTYNFTIDGGSVATIGQLVEYYIVAQDIVAIPNVIASPSTGAAGYTPNPPAAATPPTTFYSYTVTAALTTGTYTVGVAGNFVTLTAAVNAYNNSCLDGPVVFNLIDATYPSETFPITIQANAFASAVRTLTIKPNTTSTISGNNGTALIKLNGADYIIIDGSNSGGTSRDLTIQNTNANTTATVLWVASASVTDGATNNIIKNVNVTGGGTTTGLYGIVSSSGATLGAAATFANSNNTYQNCHLRSAQYGFYINGRATAGFADQGLLITGNTIGSSAGAEKILYRGMFIQNVGSFNFSANTILGIVMTSGFVSNSSGIYISGNVANGNIFNNRISDIKQQNTGGFGAHGILLNSATGSNISIYNNFIWDVASYGGAGVTLNDNGYGIMVNAGGGYNIYYNSILMGTNQTAATGTAAAINIASGVNSAGSVNIRNNVFANTQTIGNRYCIYSGAAANVYGVINNNDYYTISATLGFLGTPRANLTAWRTATGQDANSLAANPLFISGVNLHVQNTSPLHALAVPVGSITTDIDGDVRDVSTPDIGADEFIAPDCNSSIVGGTAVAAAETICGTGSTTFISATGYTVGGSMVYQWEYSTISSGGPWTPHPGATNPTGFTTGALNTTTYFQLYALCQISGEDAVSNPVTVTVNNPQITSTTPGTRCGYGPVTLSATGSFGTAVNWYAAPTGGVALQTGNSYTPTISTTTTFYAGASIGGISEVGGKLTPFSNSSFHTNTAQWGVVFTANSALTLNSTVIYPTGTGNITIMLVNSAGVELASTPSIPVSGSGLSTPVTVPLGFTVPIGTGYRLLKKVSSGITGLVRDISGAAFPYNSPSNALSVTSSWTTGVSSTTYYWFYEINISTGCESSRTPVVATSTPAPAISASATQTTICAGQSTTLNVTSGNTNYVYQWMPGSLNGPSHVVSPLLPTIYTVTATDGGTNCVAIQDVTITVNRSPAVPVVSPDITVCSGNSTVLTAISFNPTASLPDYVFSTSTGAALDPMGGAIALVPSSVDDTPSPLTNIGFTFNFDNTNYTQFTASPDGWIKLGAPVATAQFTNNLTGTTNNPKLSAYWDDLATGSTGHVRYVMTGIAPNRILKINWFIKTIRLPLADPANSSFQMWLYETTNRIEYRYGVMSAPSGTSNISCGLTQNATNFWSVTFSTNTATTATADNSNNIVPASGRMYAFQPEQPTITWSPATGLSGTTGSPVTATPATTTTYTATATNAIGCTRSTPVTVTVSPSAASVSIAASPAGPVCAGTSVTFTATPTNGGATPTYQWYVNGGIQTGQTGVTFTSSTLANGDIVTVQFSSSSTCVTGNPYTSNQINMAVIPPAPASVTITANPAGAICAGTSVTFTPVPTNGGGSPTYQWFVGATPVGSGPTYTTTTLTNGQVVTVVMTSNANCATGSPATSPGLTMTVNPNQTASVSIVASPAGSICAGTSVTFTPTPVNGGGSPTYSWLVNGSPVAAGPTYTTTTLVNGDIVSVSMTSSAPCTTPSPVASGGITMVVTGALATSVSIAASGAVCTGGNVTFTATPTNGGTPSYQWQVNGFNTGINSSTHTYAAINGDQVQVFMTTSLSCAAPANSSSNIITVALNVSPSFAPSPSAACSSILPGSGQVSLITSNGVAGSGSITGYQWQLGGIDIGGATASTYNAAAAGSYTVTVTNSNGCSTTSTPVVISAVAGPLAAGIYPIPGSGCSGFSSIANAVNYLNTNGISGSGGVIFNIAGGYTETAPSGGFRITASGTATNQIIFRKAGGANPIITAFTPQAAGSLNDAVFKLSGADFISIRDLTIQENGANTTTTAGTNNMTEFGIALLQASVTNGAQNDSISGNTISLNKTYANTFGIYSNASHAEANVGAATSITNATGAHSNNRILSNNISNVNVGIAMIGSAAGGFYDADNIIGGALLASGNTLTNWGGLPLASVFVNAPTASTYGIAVFNQTGENVSFNTLTSSSLSGISGVGVNTRGIHKSYSVNPPSGTFTSAISNNTITLTGNYTAAGAYDFQAIRSEVLSLATATININNNNIINCTLASGGTPTTTFILSSASPGTLNINNNVIDGLNSPAGQVTGLSVAGATAAVKTMNGNAFRNIIGTGIVNVMNVNGSTASCAINSNTIEDIVAGTGSSNAITVTGTGGLVASLTGNTIDGFSSAFTLSAINLGSGSTGFTADNNTITNLTSTGGAGATLSGIQTLSPATIINNNINTLAINTVVPVSANLVGVFILSTGVVNVNNNIISGLVSNSISGNGTTTGLLNGIMTSLGATVNIAKNRIFDLTLSGSNTTALIHGIHITAGTAVAISNNYISDLKAPNTSSLDALRGIGMTAATANATYNIYYNTIYLKAVSSQPTFGTSGIFHAGNATATTAVLNLRNNIIVNESTPGATAGLTVALRKAITSTANYALTSNNNGFYAGIPSATNLLYYDGTNSYQDMASFQAGATVTPRESASVSALPVFINSTVAPYNLHLVTTTNCSFDGTAVPIPGFTDDYDNQVRNVTTPDMGADEIAGTGAGLGVWVGNNTIWMDPDNWCGQVPTATTNVTIPAGRPFYPVINTAAPVARNITIAAAANIAIDPGGTLTAKGNVANSGTLTNNGNIVLSGTIAQSFPGAAGTIAAMNNLEINNAAGANIDRAFAVSGALLPTLGTITLNNNNITIASNATTGTARVGPVGTTNAFVYNGTGRFVVERYIKTGTGGGQHGKSWQLLATPTSGQTINAAWQEGNAPLGNVVPNYGTIITGMTPASGFDIVTAAGASMKTYNWNTAIWDNIANTTSPIAEKRGYMVLVRGDRSVQTSAAPATPTTLRTTGQLYAPGANAPASTTVQPSKFESVGNPYASAIDFQLISKTNVDDKIYVWDPLLTGAYGLGGFQTITGPGWLPVPGGTTNYPSATPVTTIQSGQAFLVFNSAGVAGTLNFAETNKVAGNANVFRLTGPVSSLSTSLFAVNGSEDAIADGNLVLFDPAYAAGIDKDDAIKLVNTGENFGILSHGEKLAVEARGPVVTSSDTIFYSFSNLRVQGYKLKFEAANIDATGLEAYLADKFTGTHTPVNLNGGTTVGIDITTDPASSAPDRFMIVFKKIIPLSYTEIKAEKESEDVKVSWKVSYETAIDHYEVERSADGVNFSMIKAQTALNLGTGSYAIMDEAPLSGNNYYRIRSVSISNNIVYSNIVKVRFDKIVRSITVHPNPLQEDKVLNITITGEKGEYEILVHSATGITIFKSTVEHSGGTVTYPVKLDLLIAHGTYMVTVIAPDRKKMVFKVVY